MYLIHIYTASKNKALLLIRFDKKMVKKWTKKKIFIGVTKSELKEQKK